MIPAWLLWILHALYALFIGWLVGLFKLVCELRAEMRHQINLHDGGHDTTRCQVIPPGVYKRPDPLIYCQQYLMSLGLAVTWDNPDIQLYSIGPPPNNVRTPVPSNHLAVDTDYEIWATIYNGSNEAPAVGMEVDFSFLSFGVGTVSTPIGTTVVDLPVRGAPGHPTIAKRLWHTPNVGGHYCIQVKLNWADDANPNNNLGQENTNVEPAHSPAVFKFPVRNANVVPETIVLEADGYVIPEPLDCDRVEDNVAVAPRRWETMTDDERDEALRERCQSLASPHRVENFPVPADWAVDIAPREFALQPGAVQAVTVSITPPAGFTGSRAININAFNAKRQLLGGVTLSTTR